MFLWLNLILSCILSLGFKPFVYNDFRNTNFSTETSESLNCSETKVRDNYAITYDYFFLFLKDLDSEMFADVLFSNSITNLGIAFNNFPSDYEYPTTPGSSITATIGDAVNGSVFGYFREHLVPYNIIGIGGYPISEISFTKYYVSLEGTQKYYSYEMTISGRQGNGTRVDYVSFVYNYFFPLRYRSSSATYISLGNTCYLSSYEFPSGSPLSYDNYYQYVYQEYLGDGYSSPLYNAFYGGLSTDMTVEQARRDGYNEGWSNGRSSGINEGKQIGYADGIQYAQSQDTTALTIFTGIVDIGLLPVNVFLKIFEFEVFGINVAGALSALLTIAITFIILRFVTGKKND